MGMDAGREGKRADLAGGWTGHRGRDGMGTLMLSLLKNKNTIYFSNCCLFPLENTGIINELPVKKNYIWGKEVTGPGVVLELRGEPGG